MAIAVGDGTMDERPWDESRVMLAPSKNFFCFTFEDESKAL